MWSSNRNDLTVWLIVGITILSTLLAQEFLVPGSVHKVVNEIQSMSKLQHSSTSSPTSSATKGK